MKPAYRRMEGAAPLLLWCLVVLTLTGRHVASVSETPEVCSSPLRALLLPFLEGAARCHAIMYVHSLVLFLASSHAFFL